jgi:hypothetical protein
MVAFFFQMLSNYMFVRSRNKFGISNSLKIHTSKFSFSTYFTSSKSTSSTSLLSFDASVPASVDPLSGAP